VAGHTALQLRKTQVGSAATRNRPKTARRTAQDGRRRRREWRGSSCACLADPHSTQAPAGAPDPDYVVYEGVCVHAAQRPVNVNAEAQRLGHARKRLPTHFKVKFVVWNRIDDQAWQAPLAKNQRPVSRTVEMIVLGDSSSSCSENPSALSTQDYTQEDSAHATSRASVVLLAHPVRIARHTVIARDQHEWSTNALVGDSQKIMDCIEFSCRFASVCNNCALTLSSGRSKQPQQC
jgi:hypothetical protein